jgi:hypothetical protein
LNKIFRLTLPHHLSALQLPAKPLVLVTGPQEGYEAG